MTETIDPLDGIQGDHVIEARRDYPALHIVEGDRLIVRGTHDADAGQVVVAKSIQGGYTVNEVGLLADSFTVVGVVVGLVRRLL